MSIDPIGFGVNWYVYALNDPINLFEWFGLESEEFERIWLWIGPEDRPWLIFTNTGVSEGLKTGLAAVGSSFTFGLWSGGEYRNKPGFEESRILADIGLTAGLGAAGTWGMWRYKGYMITFDIYTKHTKGVGINVLKRVPKGSNIGKRHIRVIYGEDTIRIFGVDFNKWGNPPQPWWRWLHYHKMEKSLRSAKKHRPWEQSVIMWKELLEKSERYRRSQTCSCCR